MERKLDRVVKFDEKSREFSIIDLIEKIKERIAERRRKREERKRRRRERNKKVVEVIPNKIWTCDEYLDQGTEGACVGFAWAHELNATPFEIAVKESTAKTIYYAAQQWDQWEGTEYDGTSVLAGAKVVSSIGHMPEYRWAFGIDDVVKTLTEYGPVVLGIAWYEGMFNTNENGFIEPVGDPVGGHAILANGIDVAEKVGGRWVDLPEPIIRLHNSWGKSWGVNGDAFITASDLGELLDEQGEACVPVKRL